MQKIERQVGGATAITRREVITNVIAEQLTWLQTARNSGDEARAARRIRIPRRRVELERVHVVRTSWMN